MAELIVCVQSLRVLANNQTIFNILGHHQIICQSILILTGPRSDPLMLQSAIKSMQTHKLHLVLYDASGCERFLMVSCCPFDDSFTRSLVTLYPSDAITLQDAFADRPSASVLVSADPPHVIHMVNDKFLGRFGCARSEVLGQPLHLLYKEESFNVSRFLDTQESDKAWSALLDAAVEGRATRRSLATVGAFFGSLDVDEVTCKPVVEGLNGRIRHVLIHVNLSEGLEPQPHAQVLHQPGSNRYIKRPDRPQVETACAAPAWDTSDCSLKLFICPRLRSVGPAIFPRRKTRTIGSQGDTLAPPVVVTSELVATLAHLPLQQAAAAAGVSATAFKKACRKLGISRWAYKRGRIADRVAAVPPTVCAVKTGTDESCREAIAQPSPQPCTALIGSSESESVADVRPTDSAAALSCSLGCAGCVRCRSALSGFGWLPDADEIGPGTPVICEEPVEIEDLVLDSDLVGTLWPIDA